ncbi:hypothetical protein DPMN_077785 [Dreissena polymorpha]|uniref:Uncharacterized protein n=1 Tax=Dreissena polymorpha TaxID=45954 RepID=A0A9D3YQ00_DREPO|nr:hypothetical protein DPMN_077785 [Dreissena polymorpha]
MESVDSLETFGSSLPHPTSMVAGNSARLGLTINKGNSNMFRTYASNNTPITVQGVAVEEVDSFTYLGSIQYIQNPHHDIGITNKCRLFNTIVKPLLLYGTETQITPVTTINKLMSSSTPASERSSRFAGQTRSTTNNYGEEHSSCQLKKTSYRYPASNATRQLSHRNPKEKGREGAHGPNMGKLEIHAQNRDSWWKHKKSPRERGERERERETRENERERATRS